MIDQIDQQLREWAQKTLDASAAVVLTPPNASLNGPAVNLYLLELGADPPLRGSKRAPLQLALCYLVTVWDEEPEKAHRLLGQLVFAAMDHAEFEVEFDAVPIAAWVSFGVAPRPSFLLKVPLRQERATSPAPRVAAPLDVVGSPMTQLYGILLGPNKIALAGARVELPALQRSTQTDSKGRFRFNGIAAEPSVQQLRINAKGEILEVGVQQPTSEDEPAVVDFDLFG